MSFVDCPCCSDAPHECVAITCENGEQEACGLCDGSGKAAEANCPSCRGTGAIDPYPCARKP